MKSPLISILIASFNGLNFIKPCLESIFQSEYKNFEVIVVDNGSIDGSREYLEKIEREKKIKLIKNKKNLGCAKATNQAANEAKGELLFLLNHDTILEKDCLTEISKGLPKDVWAAQCKIRQLNNKKEIQTIGALLVPKIGIAIGKKGRGEEDRGQYNQKDVILSSDTAQVINTEVFKKLGMFESAFFAGYEDIDFDYRIYMSNKKEILLPKAIVYHDDHSKHSITKQRIKIGAFFISKGVLLFVIRNYQFSSLIKYLIPSLVYSFLISLFPVFKKNFYPILGFFLGIGWTIYNLKSIILKRKNVQKMRTVDDKEIFNNVGINLSYKQIFNYIKNGRL